jgi:carboxypeptidase-like protein/TonB-dependent receptor-like protein
MHHRRNLTRSGLAILLSAFTVQAVAQDTTVTLVGAVIDSASSMPVAEVVVYVDGRNFTDTTDYAGEFSIGDLLGGKHVVLLMREGYSPDMVQLTLPENMVGEADVGVVLLSHGPPPDAVLTGTVVDSRTGQPVIGVSVDLNGQPVTATDVTGRFRIEGAAVDWGGNVLAFRRIGYDPMEAELWVTEQRTDLDLDIALVPSAIPLAEVVVEGNRATYVEGLTQAFYRRRRVGYGSFFDKQEIEDFVPRVVTDILRRAPGVRVVSRRGGDWVIRFSRSIKDCPPLLFLNGARVSWADDVNGLISPYVILGIEVYQGAQIPVEFNQMGSACGVVVIWTQ